MRELLTKYFGWSRSRAKATAPAPAKCQYPGSGRLRNPDCEKSNCFDKLALYKTKLFPAKIRAVLVNSRFSKSFRKFIISTLNSLEMEIFKYPKKIGGPRAKLASAESLISQKRIFKKNYFRLFYRGPDGLDLLNKKMPKNLMTLTH